MNLILTIVQMLANAIPVRYTFACCASSLKKGEKMSRMVSWFRDPHRGARRRIGGLVATGALIPVLVLTGWTSAAHAAGSASSSPAPCNKGTLDGRYIYSGEGSQVSAGTSAPSAFAGSERYNGAGAVNGIDTSSSNGVISPASAYTGTYNVAANCTGKLTINIAPGVVLHFDIYVAPSGETFTYVQTDPGSVSATMEQRVSS